MGMKCSICGKTPATGNSIVRRGKAKYLGGVGRKVTGISKRRFKPNLQRIRAVFNGAVKRVRVCTSCIRSGKVRRPQERKLFQLPKF